ncbi:DNA repair protein RecN [Idiomarina sp.]|uniref:DNA repair protein RecN n=1 Tax=Idiomarina sp. TaxID=1874361 RepID=UPI0025BE0C93|nr:DNA repair protein RecN [Idiomarina sp.]NQZ03716.1 DNA repair protein RecN [Idiomarina sp.]
MLTELHIRNFAIVKQLDIEFKNGMTAITGETGAGKSIALDALGLCLGGRADANWVRPGCDKTDISARFTITHESPAHRWLINNELDDDLECVLRRTISKDGRSRAWVNGAPVTLTQQRTLAPTLVNIHGQHEHQLLVKEEHQRELLDQFAQHGDLITEVQNCYRNWASTEKRFRQHQQRKEELSAQKQLLSYQVKELNEFNIADGEFEQLESDHKRLTHVRALTENSAFALNALYDGEHNNVSGLIQAAHGRLEESAELDEQIQPILALLEQAKVHIEETALELRNYQEQLDIDPEQLELTEQRMSQAIALAKKHHVAPIDLYQHHQQLQQQLDELERAEEDNQQLVEQRQALRSQYRQAALKLSTSRKQAADNLGAEISRAMNNLNMPHGEFVIQVNHDDKATATLWGTDEICFTVTTNPGQPLQALSKVASGGELSRISLAIQVMCANQNTVPTMMFDEVDVGVSGPTAAVVGSMLRSLGEQCQIICVTHLPQVAAKGHHQMQVLKQTDGAQTETHVWQLNEEQRIDELARLLGGDSITEKTKDNARELLIH